MRLRLDLGYDGTAFSGWARQPGRRTVEGVVDEALATVLRLPDRPRLTVAGRTDAGVHATGQVAHADVVAAAWAEHGDTAVRRLRGILPTDVRVMRVTGAPRGFDARFSAVRRRYTYLVGDDPSGIDPIRRGSVVWHRRPLDVDRLNDAASQLVGEHDFASFCRRREGASTVRAVRMFTWRRDDDGLVEATIAADAFCHNMVRAMVGACVAVGEGTRPASWVGQVLAATQRSSAVTVMPPHGLTLEEVTYPPDDQLAERAEESRRFRG